MRHGRMLAVLWCDELDELDERCRASMTTDTYAEQHKARCNLGSTCQWAEVEGTCELRDPIN